MNPIRCLLLSFALPALCPAQSPLVPREPVLSPAPARAEWTVHMTEKFPDSWASDSSWEAQGSDAASANEPKTIRSMAFAKDSALQTYKVTTRWSTGETEEDWVVMGTHVSARAGGGLYAVGGERMLSQEITKTDFPELAWVGLKQFTGVRSYKGKQVFVFEEQFNRKLMTPTEARRFAFAQQADPKATPEKVFQPRSAKVFAYLDAATQLPVLCNDGRKIYRYTFKTPDVGRLRPPQNIIDFLRKRQAAFDARLTPPAGPGSSVSAAKE